MGKFIKKFEHKSTTGGGVQKHNWDEIFSAHVDDLDAKGHLPAYQCIEGEDFTGKPENFASMCRFRATERHLNVKITLNGEKGKRTVNVTVASMTDEQAAKADARIAHIKERDKASFAKRKAAKEATETPDEAQAEVDNAVAE